MNTKMTQFQSALRLLTELSHLDHHYTDGGAHGGRFCRICHHEIVDALDHDDVCTLRKALAFLGEA